MVVHFIIFNVSALSLTGMVPGWFQKHLKKYQKTILILRVPIMDSSQHTYNVILKKIDILVCSRLLKSSWAWHPQNRCLPILKIYQIFLKRNKVNTITLLFENCYTHRQTDKVWTLHMDIHITKNALLNEEAS